MQYIWMAVTADEYELPLYVADTRKELADKLGLRPCTIATAIKANCDGSISGRRYIKLEVDDESCI